MSSDAFLTFAFVVRWSGRVVLELLKTVCLYHRYRTGSGSLRLICCEFYDGIIMFLVQAQDSQSFHDLVRSFWASLTKQLFKAAFHNV